MVSLHHLDELLYFYNIFHLTQMFWNQEHFEEIPLKLKHFFLPVLFLSCVTSLSPGPSSRSVASQRSHLHRDTCRRILGPERSIGLQLNSKSQRIRTVGDLVESTTRLVHVLEIPRNVDQWDAAPLKFVNLQLWGRDDTHGRNCHERTINKLNRWFSICQLPMASCSLWIQIQPGHKVTWPSRFHTTEGLTELKKLKDHIKHHQPNTSWGPASCCCLLPAKERAKETHKRIQTILLNYMSSAHTPKNKIRQNDVWMTTFLLVRLVFDTFWRFVFNRQNHPKG